MKNLIQSYLLMLSAVFLFNCKGDDGDPGPKGEQGNANVVAKTYTLSKDKWTFAVYQLEVPEITKAIVDSGSVEVYHKGDFGWSTFPLVKKTYNSSGDLQTTSTYNISYETGKIYLIGVDEPAGFFGGSPLTEDLNIKVVIIAGNKTTAEAIPYLKDKIDLN